MTNEPLSLLETRAASAPVGRLFGRVRQVVSARLVPPSPGCEYRVETFTSAEEFLKGDRSGGAGCVVLDLQMAGPSGLELQEVLLALEKEGTVVIEPYKGATVKPLAYRLAKQASRSNSAKEQFEYDRRFGILFSRRPTGLFFGRCSGNWTTE